MKSYDSIKIFIYQDILIYKSEIYETEVTFDTSHTIKQNFPIQFTSKIKRGLQCNILSKEMAQRMNLNPTK